MLTETPASVRVSSTSSVVVGTTSSMLVRCVWRRSGVSSFSAEGKMRRGSVVVFIGLQFDVIVLNIRYDIIKRRRGKLTEGALNNSSDWVIFSSKIVKKPNIFRDSLMGFPIELRVLQIALNSLQYVHKDLFFFESSWRLRQSENSREMLLLLKFSASDNQICQDVLRL